MPPGFSGYSVAKKIKQTSKCLILFTFSSINMPANSSWHALKIIEPCGMYNQDDNNIPIGDLSRAFPKCVNSSQNASKYANVPINQL